MTAMQAYHAFWSSFGIPAYDIYTVPDNAKLPYITYEASNDYFDTQVQLSVSVWYRSSSWSEITSKVEQIAERLGRGGVQIPCDNGTIWIKRQNPWAQRMDDPSDNMVRRIVLNIEAEFNL